VNASDLALRLGGIDKRFGRTVALSGAQIAVRPGTVHALLGENGAGKTSLMRVAFGMIRPDAGTIHIAGKQTVLRSPAAAIGLGIGMVHQHFTNVPAMTVAQNVALGGHGRFRADAAAKRVRELGDASGLRLDPNDIVEDLPIGAQQRLEIVKALSRDARLLILDEPTAVLAPREAQELLAWLRSFATGERAVILITHKLSEALATADDVTVLRHGRTVLEIAARTVDASTVARSMLGESAPDLPGEAPAAKPGDVIVRAERVAIEDDRGVTVVRDASFELRAGEITGIVGVEGAGQHQLLRALAQRHAISGGTLTAPATIGFVPEDRHRDALVLDLDLAENVALINASTRRGRMRWAQWRERTSRLMTLYDVRAEGPRVKARTLSGGNQQRLVIGRELELHPAVLVVENPTRGLDIKATAAVHQRLRSAATEGTAVVVYSSDIDEVLSLAHRLFALHAGVMREVRVDREIAGRAMLGLA
jgi:general nucleoside transport system ATP-binding protein